MTKTRPDRSERDIYEMATEVRKDNSNSTTDSGNDSLNASDDALAFAEYDVPRPVAQENPQSQPQIIYSQADKKRAARTAQKGATKATPGDGKENGGEVGKDGVVSDSMNDITLVDNALYANVSASPSAATKGRINEPICTSINDFTLVDNVVYNN